MPRHPRKALRTRKRSPVVASAPRTNPRVGRQTEGLVSLLAHHPTSRPKVLTELHEEALEATGGECSLLFEISPRTAVLHSTSGYRIETLGTDPWSPTDSERALVSGLFARRSATYIADLSRRVPELALRLGTPRALLVPLAYGPRHVGLLAIGFRGAQRPTGSGNTARVADAFVTTLEWFRLRRREEVQADIREILSTFAVDLSSSFNMATSLGGFCQSARWLFGSDRMSVWLHDRHLRQLALLASSDPEHVAHSPNLPADDPLTPASAIMRRARAQFLAPVTDLPTGTLAVPLRGRRRALGLLMLEGVRMEAGSELDLLDRADELGAELSSAIENMQLLTGAIRSRRERDHPRDEAGDLLPQSMLEAEREELRHQVTQSEKLVALGQFIAGIAHELNNPLQGVLGHLELLRTTGAFPSHLDADVQTIYKEAERAAKIVHNLLVFAGSRRLSRRWVSLNGVLQRVVALRKAACRAQGIEVVRHYDRKVPRVQSDPLLLHQVFLNMVTNAEQAIAATGRGGRIEIASTMSRSGDRIVATVRDTGDGIPPDALSRIFEPFYTTKEVGKGTGLGLAIVYGIVQEHGGHISAANHPDGGAIFRVELPIRPTP